MAVNVIPPYPVFSDAEGESLEAGFIYVGVAGTNPLIETNRIATYSNSGLTTPIAQPIRTNGGFLVNSGTPTQVYVNAGDYSIVVLDKNGELVFSSLFNVTESVPSTFFRYDITPAEVTAGVTPVNYYYPPGYPERFQLNTIPGTTDMTAAINAAAVSGILYLQGQSYKTSGLVTLPVVDIIALGSALIMGTGTVRGVVQNTEIPHQILQVPYNLVTAAERSLTVRSGDFFVDPLLGSDTYSGLSAALPVATLTKAAALVAGVAASAPSVTVVLRSGRHETAGIALNGTHTLVSGGNVTWTGNPGEEAVVTAPTTWFFNSSTKKSIYGAYSSVDNTLGYAFYDLYDAETGVQVECAHNMSLNYAMPRNQVAVIAAPVGNTIKITVTAADTANLAALSAGELAGVRARISHSFTSSWHDAFGLAGSVVTMSSLATSGIYYNGWNQRGVDGFGAPYLLQNLKTLLNGRNFAAYSTDVYLPKTGTNYFTVDRSVLYLFNTGAAARHVFSGVSFRYLAMGTSKLLTFWVAGPFFDCGFIVGGSGRHTVMNCKFAYGNANGVVMSQTNAIVVDSEFEMLGICGVGWNNTNGSDACVVRRNKVRRWGHYSTFAGIGIYGGGVGIDLSDNDIRNGPWTALRADSGANIVTPSGQVSGTLKRNICMNVGMIDGVPADYLANNDSGVLTIYGGSSLGAFSAAYEVAENVVGPGHGFQYIRGIFGDDGINGCNVHDNLVWGQVWYAFDFRQVGASTFNNSVRRNLFLGTVNLQSATNTSDFSGNIVAATTRNFVDSAPAVANLTQNAFGLKCVTTEQYATVDGQDPAFTLPSTTNYTYYVISPFTRSYLKFGSFISTPPAYENTAIQGGQNPIITATYIVQDIDHELTFNRGAGVTITLPIANVANAGREIYVRTIAAGTVISASANVLPLAGGVAGTVILAATAGRWAKLVCDGGVWNITAAN